MSEADRFLVVAHSARLLVQSAARARHPVCALDLFDDADTGRFALHSEAVQRSEEHTSELQSLTNLVCRLLLEKKKNRSVARTRMGGMRAPPRQSTSGADLPPHS